MKHLFLVLLALISFGLVSCQQKQNGNTTKDSVAVQQTETKPKAKPRYKVLSVVDSVSALYPKMFDNDIQKKKFCNTLFKAVDAKLKADNNYLSEIPLRFSQMLQKGSNKYILKFECDSEFITEDKGLETNKYMINYAVFAEATEEEASELEENKKYHITGTYVGSVNGKLSLPGGQVFNYNTDCYKYGDHKGTICLGGFLYKNIKYK